MRGIGPSIISPIVWGGYSMTIPDGLPVVAPADHIPGPSQGQWTYVEYASIPDDGARYEIVDGVLYMAPALVIAHQDAAGRFYFYLMTHVSFAGLHGQAILPSRVVPGMPVPVEQFFA